MLTTKEAALRMGKSVARVKQLIKSGELKAEKHGRDHAIQEKDVAKLRVRQTGRPRKEPRGLRNV